MRDGKRLLAIAASVLGLAGCWPAPGAGPNRQSFNAIEQGISVDDVDTFDVAWTFETVGSAPRGVGPPVVSTNGVLAVATDHALYGLDPRTGATRWEQPETLFLDAELHQAGDRGLLYALSETATEHFFKNVAIDPGTGLTEELAFGSRGRIDGVRGDHLVLSQPTSCCGYHEIASVDLPTGQRRTGAVVAYNSDPDVSRLTAGTERAYQAGQGASNTTPSSGGGQVAGIRAFAYDRFLATCGQPQSSPTLACPVWVTPTDGTTATSPVLTDDEATLFSVTDVGTVYAVDTATGAVEWSTSVGAAVAEPPALAYGRLFVPTVDGRLVAVDAGTGSVEWSTTGTSELTVQPAVAGGVVFTGASDGTVAAYDAHGCGAATCAAIWSDGTGSAITGDPAISLGKVFVGTQDGRVIAYGAT
jgi:outer membrane protein assembly factor BamB